MRPNLALRSLLALLLTVLSGASRANESPLEAAAEAAHFGKRTVHRGHHYALALPSLTTASGVAYRFAFDDSAIYTLSAANQLDYNKLPGFSDCGSIDLAQNGAMFGWRWNPATQRVQISAYANAGGRHQYWENHPSSVKLVELDPKEFLAFAPLHYAIEIQGGDYTFRVWGTLPGGRVIDASSRLQRGCSDRPRRLKLGSTLYFGGTQTAPHDVSGWVLDER